MNISKISPDDPRLTAYALGELDAAESAAIEAAINDDPAVQAAVAQIRSLGEDLSVALSKEPLPFVAPAIEVKSEKPPAREAYRPRVFLRLPFYLAGGLAAACVVGIFVVNQREVKLHDEQLAEAKAERRQFEAEYKKKALEEKARRDSGYLEVALGEEEHRVSLPRMQLPSLAEKPSASTAVIGDTKAEAFKTETYDRIVDNSFLDTAGNPLSTFSADVDTASYTNARRFILRGQRPPKDSVRIEEWVNYFPYNYSAPKDDKPFAASMEVASAPWNPQHRLVRIGLKGREVAEAERPPLNLVFLLDVSGSMDESNKLPLVKTAMRMLLEKLKPADRVGIVVYAGASGLALPSTPVAQKAEILEALEALRPGGSTNGAMGIQLAYDIAKANFIKGGANRVVLCTDGDFNIGVTNQGDLTRLIEDKAKSGVFLSVLGFGMGNLKDSTLEKLADKGNGNFGYVDNSAEAKKLLVDQLSGTLVTIAKDVKLQVEFNPAKVKAYRLIGYENRMLAKEDFNNDKIDAGEIGAGHTVTALYEVVPVGSESSVETPAVDPLKYQSDKPAEVAQSNASPEMLTLKIRYKAPDSDVSSKLEFPLVDGGGKFADASHDFKFAAAVAGFGMMLRESPHKGAATFASILTWAESGVGEDAAGYRHEFLDLVKRVRSING
ncbi:MAG: VWA domain-containing protein [Nibricoccus sp.]